MLSLGLFCFATSFEVSAATPKPLSISVHLHKISQADFSRLQILQLHRKLLVRLTEAGFAVVSPRLSSELKATLQINNNTISVTIAGGSFKEVRQVVRSGVTMEHYHLGVIHKLLSAAQRVRWRFQKAKMHKRKVPKTKTPTRKTKRAKTNKMLQAKGQRVQSSRVIQKPKDWGFAMDVTTLGLYRVYNTDLLLRLGLSWGQKQGFRVSVSGLFTPSNAPNLTVLEWGLQVGPSWRQFITPTFALETGLLLGFSHHYFVFQNQGSDPNQHWDFLGNLYLAAHWQPLKFLGFRPWLSLGLTTRERQHTENNNTLWLRSQVRFEFGLSLYFPLS